MASNTNPLSSEPSDNKAEQLPAKEESCWQGRSICRIDKITWLLGAALLITGIVLLVLESTLHYPFHIAGLVSASCGGGVVFFALLSNCCLTACDKSTEGMGSLSLDLDKAEVVKKTYVPVGAETSTTDFFASKGIFGVPQELVDQLDIWRMYRRGEDLQGLSFEAGFLLHGPPGTGKTTIAKAIAELLGGEYSEHQAGSLKNKFQGDTEKNITRVFTVPEGAFRVIMIDEVSGLLSHRNSNFLGLDKHSSDYVEHFLGTVSGETETKPRYLTIGTTNKIKEIDEAVLRDGRLGTQYLIDLPDETTRAQIFNYHLNKFTHSDEEDWGAFATACAKKMRGATGAAIVKRVNTAQRKALLAKRPLRQEDFK